MGLAKKPKILLELLDTGSNSLDAGVDMGLSQN